MNKCNKCKRDLFFCSDDDKNKCISCQTKEEKELYHQYMNDGKAHYDNMSFKRWKQIRPSLISFNECEAHFKANRKAYTKGDLIYYGKVLDELRVTFKLNMFDYMDGAKLRMVRSKIFAKGVKRV